MVTVPRVSGMKRTSVAVVSVVLFSSCGGGDNSASDTTSAPTIAPTTGSSTTVAGEVVNADPVLVDLADFKITIDTTTFKAGLINFHISNLGDTPHEFGIARGNSYEELPQLANGSIDEDALGDDLLGRTPIVDKVLAPTRDISFTLEAGNYVLFCNLVVGPVSHAARGHVLSITVVDG